MSTCIYVLKLKEKKKMRKKIMSMEERKRTPNGRARISGSEKIDVTFAQADAPVIELRRRTGGLILRANER